MSPRNFTWKEKQSRLEKPWNTFYKEEPPWTLPCSSPPSPILFQPVSVYPLLSPILFLPPCTWFLELWNNTVLICPWQPGLFKLGWEEKHGVGQCQAVIWKRHYQRGGDPASVRMKRSVSRVSGMKNNSLTKMRSLVWLEGTKEQSRKVKVERWFGPRLWAPKHHSR